MASRIIRRHLPCFDQDDCKSSDALNVYEEGTSFCFSCRKWFPAGYGEFPEEQPRKQESKMSLEERIEEIKGFPSRGFQDRKITKTTAEFFGVHVSYNEEGQIDSHYYPYENGTAFKVRKLPKDFTWVGKSTDLFGRDKFNQGGKRVYVAEGEIDVMSIAEAMKAQYDGKIYPVVGLSTSVIAPKSLLENRDWLRSFDEVIFCFDNDEAGLKATEDGIRIIGLDKVKIVKFAHKDPNEVLQKEGAKSLMKDLFNATAYVPSGIITKEELWEQLVAYNEKQSDPYPPCLEGLNTKIKGMRGGEITLFISGTGSGKSTMLREIVDHGLLTRPADKFGIISLEESPAETARKQAAMRLMRNPAHEEISVEDLKPAFDEIFGSDRIMLLDHQGAMNDGSIIDKLEYMILSGCNKLLVDHITILISEGAGKLSGNEAQDKVMNDLLRLVKRHPQVWIGLVSHLRKATGEGKSFEEGRLPSVDDIRGSGSTKQISFDIIAFARNMTAKSDEVRNRIRMSVLKSRFSGLTGQVPGAQYDYFTGRLHARDTIDPEDDEEEFVEV